MPTAGQQLHFHQSLLSLSFPSFFLFLSPHLVEVELLFCILQVLFCDSQLLAAISEWHGRQRGVAEWNEIQNKQLSVAALEFNESFTPVSYANAQFFESQYVVN